MKSLLKLTGLGLIIWSLSLGWPEINRVLTPVVMIGLFMGLGVTWLAYFLGRYVGHPFTRQRLPKYQIGQNQSKRSTRPVSVIFPARNRQPGTTRPVSIIRVSDFHSRATQPIPVTPRRNHHSCATQPLPVNIAR